MNTHAIKTFLADRRKIKVLDPMVGSEKRFTLHKLHKSCKIAAERNHIFSGRKTHKHLFQRAKGISVPKVETKAIELFESAMDYVKDYNLSKIKHVTPQEVYERDKIVLGKYAEPKTLDYYKIDLYELSQSLKFIKEEMFQGKSRTLTFDEAVSMLPKDTSSCYPLFKKKRDEDAIEEARRFISKVYSCSTLEEMLDLFYTQYVYVFHRFTMKLNKKEGEIERNLKVRQVYGAPFSFVILEAMLFGDVQSKYSKVKLNNGYFTYGFKREQVSMVVKNMRNEAIRSSKKIFCADITDNDASIVPLIPYWFYEFYLSHLKLTSKQAMIATAMCTWYIFTPVSWNSRRLLTMYGGNISGSYITSTLNSFTTLLISNYSYRKLYGTNLDPSKISILGDDFIMLLDRTSHSNLVRSYFGHFSMKLHAGKSKTVGPFDMINYLGFNWNQDNMPTNPDTWYIAKICFPERFVDVPGHERIIQRAASILYQIIGGHEIFMKVFAVQIPSFLKLLKSGVDPQIRYYDTSGSYYFFSMPYSRLISAGWRCY
jgi:hypothetical protein